MRSADIPRVPRAGAPTGEERPAAAGPECRPKAAANWIEAVPALAGLEEAARADLLARSIQIAAPLGTRVFATGRVPEDLLILTHGTLRVQQPEAASRATFLYRVLPGETCLLTAACLLGDRRLPAEGVAESALRAVLVPRNVVEGLLATSDAFRRFVFGSLSRRVADVMQVADEIAARGVDFRLARALLAMAAADGTVTATHEVLARDLGMARRIVSRHLREFRSRGWVNLSRGGLWLADAEALRRLARL
jgi:CRP/FNR family transcriptional regulator, anaerobic regulatory protein